MATQVINHEYRLKRGAQEAVERVDPLLAAGEPLVVFCTDGSTRLKIGDGKHRYSELEWVGSNSEKEVLTFSTRLEFPVPPARQYKDAIYKATNEAKLYQWNESKYKYESLDNVDVEVRIDDIDTISGGEISDLIEMNI